MLRTLRGSLVLGGMFLALTLLAAPASAAKSPNACRLVKKRKIAKVFGGATVGKGKLSRTPASSRCDYKVGAVGDRPAGTVTVHVMTIGAKAAYDGLKTQTADFVPAAGLGKAIYSQKLGVVDVLHGNKLVGVQGVFETIDNGGLHQYDAHDQVFELVKVARKHA